MGIEKVLPDYIVAEDSLIPYYKPIFYSKNNFGNYAVYKKSKNLPGDGPGSPE